MASRYVVGIDLGTTNSALAYVDTAAGEKEQRPVVLPIPQVVQPGVVEDRPLLPSFLYLPRPGEVPAGSLRLPWAPERDFAVGEYPRQVGNQVETRLVSSAKSWLCHSGVDRKSAILPWKAGPDDRHVSPLEATTLYLRHIAEAWNHRMAGGKDELRLENQDVILTVPASFDAVARELTVEAARAAGLQHLTLLEEPQSAFYAWIEQQGDGWRKQVKLGDVVLVCDVGGGTTDLSLIALSEDAGRLVLTRVAVGDHILLGGDNMDWMLAYVLAQEFAARSIKLDLGQMQMLRHSCREAKEALPTPKLPSAPVTVVGRGSKVIAGTLKGESTWAALERELPEVLPRGPRRRGAEAAADDRVPGDRLAVRQRPGGDGPPGELPGPARGRPGHTGGLPRPTAVLFNGGVSGRAGDAAPDRQRAQPVGPGQRRAGPRASVRRPRPGGAAGRLTTAWCGARQWAPHPRRHGPGVLRRGRDFAAGGPGGAAALEGAVRGVPWHGGGDRGDVPGQEFGLVVGAPAEFRFLGSTARREDAVGTLVDDWVGDVEEMTPMQAALAATSGQGQIVPVHLHSKVTEVGTLELWCISRDGKRWKLEFNVRG
ncbi:MAG: Hsp70 family protein [Gemmataceae bacterium]